MEYINRGGMQRGTGESQVELGDFRGSLWRNLKLGTGLQFNCWESGNQLHGKWQNRTILGKWARKPTEGVNF
jgi:hypothetical protein